MQKVIYFFSFLILPLISIGQFCPDGAFWLYGVGEFVNGQWVETTMTMEYEKDTTFLGGFTGKKVIIDGNKNDYIILYEVDGEVRLWLNEIGFVWDLLLLYQKEPVPFDTVEVTNYFGQPINPPFFIQMFEPVPTNYNGVFLDVNQINTFCGNENYVSYTYLFGAINKPLNYLDYLCDLSKIYRLCKYSDDVNGEFVLSPNCGPVILSSEEVEEKSVAIYPNPSNGVLMFDGIGRLEFELISPLGLSLGSYIFDGDPIYFNIPVGIYFVSFEIEGKAYYLPFIRQ